VILKNLKCSFFCIVHLEIFGNKAENDVTIKKRSNEFVEVGLWLPGSIPKLKKYIFLKVPLLFKTTNEAQIIQNTFVICSNQIPVQMHVKMVELQNN
jgi:hypothetical protein